MEQAPRAVANREWILTNRLGGYALGFGDGINKRKYNGLLIASSPTLQRTHLLASLEEGIDFQGESFRMDSSYYPGCIYPEGYHVLVQAWLRPAPGFVYSFTPHDQEEIRLQKEIFLVEGQNAVVVRYLNLGKEEIRMTVRPKLTLRDHHHVNPSGTWDALPPTTEVENNSFHTRRAHHPAEIYGYLEEGEIFRETVIYRSVCYPLEGMRGYEATEDLVAPVRLQFSLRPRKETFLVFSAVPLKDPFRQARQAEKRYRKLPKGDYPKILSFAAQDFLTSTGEVIAGYPWFGSWARDTLISLSGIKFLPEGKKEGVRLLKRYGHFLKKGLLPNTFGEGGEGLNYDSVDAPLWYVLRCYEQAPRDPELFEKMSEVVLSYYHETGHPFFMDEDGLVTIRPGPQALTWMDARVFEGPVTPRWGKPVEINALWWNALSALREVCRLQNKKEVCQGEWRFS
ncbi:MAG: glycogen debranching enzyme N-terminal domain-containing protein, partial [bacterium]|nr:glycogen debranching enzyme N-terminal domain-containing protein [bacterium]